MTLVMPKEIIKSDFSISDIAQAGIGSEVALCHNVEASSSSLHVHHRAEL